MINKQHKAILFLLLIIATASYGFLFYNPKEVKVNFKNAPHYEINRILPYISINKKALKEAENLVDINRHYKPSWVKEFVAVEISATKKGQLQQVVSKSDQLNLAQKELINTADIDTKIMVNIKYIPDNTLKNNDVKTFNFDFIVEPENNAKYIGGDEKLSQYLEKNAIVEIPSSTFKNYDLAMIKFAVNEKGRIINTKLFNSSTHPKADELLVEAIRQMPDWQPAEYENGQKVQQEFVLTVGNMSNCMVHTLNIGTLK